MIEIVNTKHGAGAGVYVGRPSVLGNPYRVEDGGRERAVRWYRDWLRAAWKRGRQEKTELLRLARLYKAHGTLTLVCWCAPQACHAEVIQEAVLGIVEKGLV